MNIKGIILDVDGVLTDGKKYYYPGGIAKSFSVRDGKGIDLAQKEGIKFAIATADEWKLIFDRARKLKILDVYYSCHDKVSAAQEFCKKHGIDMGSELCFIGDDVNDIPLLEQVAFPVAVGDALPSVKKVCINNGGCVTEKLGGNGAVREALDYILERLHE